MDSNRPLRVLVVGAGVMGAAHAHALRGSLQAVVCGVVDLQERAAQSLASEVGVPGFTDLVKAIESTAPDAAVIATPDSAHRQPAETAIDAGLAVLVEKPLATTVDDAEAIVLRAERAGVRLMTGHLTRFYPRYAQAADLIHSGELGSPVMVTATKWGLTSLGARVAASTSPLWHFAIHEIETMHWITGGVISEVDGAQLVESSSGLSIFAATGTLSTGCAFHLATGWTLPRNSYPRRDFKVHCDRGVVEAMWSTDGLSVDDADGVRQLDCMAWPTLHGRVEGALRMEVDHFVRSVLEGTPFVIKPDEAVDAVRSAVKLERVAVRRSVS